MSSLIFCTDDNQAFVATDTLATEVDGTPLKFASKAFIVPHLKIIIAGTGTAGVLGRWFVRINDSMVVRGIDHLNHHTPGVLESLWQGYKKELSIPDAITTTVYHFGFSELTGLIHAYAYRSTDNFESERLEPHGLRFKPECTVPADYRLPHDLRIMMDEQRAIQASKPKEERVYVGGKIEVHHLTREGFQIYTFHRFEDYGQVETAIYDNFRASNS